MKIILFKSIHSSWSFVHLLHMNTSCTLIFINLGPFYNFCCCFMLFQDFMCLNGINSEIWSARNKFSCFPLGLTIDYEQNINLAYYDIHNYLKDIYSMSNIYFCLPCIDYSRVLHTKDFFICTLPSPFSFWNSTVLWFNTTQIVITHICVIFSRRKMSMPICSTVQL